MRGEQNRMLPLLLIGTAADDADVVQKIMQRMMQLRRYYLLFLVCTKQEVFCQSNIH
jgi:hypothetical protein